MLKNSRMRWGTGIVGVLLIAAGLFRPASSPSEDFVEVTDAERFAIAKELESGGYDALTKLDRRLSHEYDARQTLLLQAVPDEAPIVVAAPGDSSDEEPATHWPSPWEAVNSALKTGGLEDATTVTGSHGGFQYHHHLIPLGEDRSRVLLVNRAVPGPRWTPTRWLIVAAGCLLLVAIVAAPV